MLIIIKNTGNKSVAPKKIIIERGKILATLKNQIHLNNLHLSAVINTHHVKGGSALLSNKARIIPIIELIGPKDTKKSTVAHPCQIINQSIAPCISKSNTQPVISSLIQIQIHLFKLKLSIKIII